MTGAEEEEEEEEEEDEERHKTSRAQTSASAARTDSQRSPRTVTQRKQNRTQRMMCKCTLTSLYWPFLVTLCS